MISFLWITAHSFSRRDHKQHTPCTAAEHVRDLVHTVMSEWNIAPRNVMVVITDNGSNMMVAFVSTDGDEERMMRRKDLMTLIAALMRMNYYLMIGKWNMTLHLQ